MFYNVTFLFTPGMCDEKQQQSYNTTIYNRLILCKSQRLSESLISSIDTQNFFFYSCFFFANIKNVTMGYFRTQRCTLPARTIRKQTKEIKPKKLRDSRRWVHVGNCWKTKRQNAWKTVCETSNWLLVAMQTQQRMIWYHWCHLNMTSTLFIDGIKTRRSVTKMIAPNTK